MMAELIWEERELERLEREAVGLLRSLGLCPFRRGDQELCLLIALAAARPEQLADGLGPLYAELARRRGGNPIAVERSVRRGLRRLWRQGDQMLLRRWFARLEGGRCPGSAAFLNVLVQKLRERQALR